MLKLTRLLIIFDIESTGLNKATDRIVSLFLLLIYPDGSTKEFDYLFNPEMSIPKEVSDIHGITDDMVKDAPKFREKAQEIRDLIYNSDLGGFNIKGFDIPLLAEEMLRVFPDFDFGDVKFVDSEKIFKKRERRNLEAAVEFYCGKNLENAHNAGADVRATYEVLLKQVELYDDITGEIDNLATASNYDDNKAMVDYDNKLYKDEHGKIRYNFGKHKDRTVLEETGYAEWMLKQDWITRNTKSILRKILYSVGNGFYSNVLSEPEKEDDFNNDSDDLPF